MTRNLILGMICRNERPMLELIQPTLRDYPFLDRIVFDTGSTDGSQAVLAQNGFTLGHLKWQNNFSAARNELIGLASHFYSNKWLLMLDADETMYLADLEALNEHTQHSSAALITLPRYNLLHRATLCETGSYPDKQPRCIRLNAGVEFRNPVHEVAFLPGQSESITRRREDDFRPGCHIYHYGWCKPPLDNQHRSRVYVAIAAGISTEDFPPLSPISEAAYIDDLRAHHQIEPFTKPHPLSAHYANT